MFFSKQRNRCPWRVIVFAFLGIGLALPTNALALRALSIRENPSQLNVLQERYVPTVSSVGLEDRALEFRHFPTDLTDGLQGRIDQQMFQAFPDWVKTVVIEPTRYEEPDVQVIGHRVHLLLSASEADAMLEQIAELAQRSYIDKENADAMYYKPSNPDLDVVAVENFLLSELYPWMEALYQADLEAVNGRTQMQALGTERLPDEIAGRWTSLRERIVEFSVDDSNLPGVPETYDDYWGIRDWLNLNLAVPSGFLVLRQGILELDRYKIAWQLGWPNHLFEGRTVRGAFESGLSVGRLSVVSSGIGEMRTHQNQQFLGFLAKAQKNGGRLNEVFWRRVFQDTAFGRLFRDMFPKTSPKINLIYQFVNATLDALEAQGELTSVAALSGHVRWEEKFHARQKIAAGVWRDEDGHSLETKQIASRLVLPTGKTAQKSAPYSHASPLSDTIEEHAYWSGILELMATVYDASGVRGERDLVVFLAELGDLLLQRALRPSEETGVEPHDLELLWYLDLMTDAVLELLGESAEVVQNVPWITAENIRQASHQVLVTEFHPLDELAYLSELTNQQRHAYFVDRFAGSVATPATNALLTYQCCPEGHTTPLETAWIQRRLPSDERYGRWFAQDQSLHERILGELGNDEIARLLELREALEQMFDADVIQFEGHLLRFANAILGRLALELLAFPIEDEPGWNDFQLVWTDQMSSDSRHPRSQTLPDIALQPLEGNGPPVYRIELNLDRLPARPISTTLLENQFAGWIVRSTRALADLHYSFALKQRSTSLRVQSALPPALDTVSSVLATTLNHRSTSGFVTQQDVLDWMRQVRTMDVATGEDAQSVHWLRSRGGDAYGIDPILPGTVNDFLFAQGGEDAWPVDSVRLGMSHHHQFSGERNVLPSQRGQYQGTFEQADAGLASNGLWVSHVPRDPELIAEIETLGWDHRMVVQEGDSGHKVFLVASKQPLHEALGALHDEIGLEEHQLKHQNLREAVLLLPEVQMQASVGVIAGGLEEDVAGLAYGVMMYHRARTHAGQVVPVVFLATVEQADLLEEMGVSSEAIFIVGSSRYPTKALAFTSAKQYLQSGLGLAQVVALGVFEAISLSVKAVLTNLFGIPMDPYQATQWQQVISDVTYVFSQA